MSTSADQRLTARLARLSPAQRAALTSRLAARNGGRVFSPDPERLGEYVVSDYLRARRGRRRR